MISTIIIALQVSETILRCAKDFAFFKLLFSKIIKFLTQNIWPVKYTIYLFFEFNKFNNTRAEC